MLYISDNVSIQVSFMINACVFQSKICIDNGKFMEFHKDKNDTALDAVMERLIDENDQLVVVSIILFFYNSQYHIVILGDERVYVPLCNVADTTFRIQGTSS